MISQINNNVNENVADFELHKKFANLLQIKLSNFYKDVKGNPTDHSEQIANCGNRLVFEHFLDNQNTVKLASANFCKHRLCPYCAWRWHLKTSKMIEKTFEILGENNYYHIVLTIPNVKFLTKDFLIDLRKRATTMLKKSIKCSDYMISLEITIDANGCFHPHFHCLCILNKFIPTRKFLQTEWVKISACGGLYHICDIKKCTDNKISQELTKYILKFEGEDIDEKKLHIINKSIKGIRKFATNGTIKKAEAKAKDELMREQFDELKELSNYDSELYFYEWLGSNYNLSKIVEISKEDREKKLYQE